MTEQRVELALPSATGRIREARARIRDTAELWALPAELTEDLVLAASELVTNAVVHARSQVRITLIRKADCVRLEVADDHPGQPEAGDGPEDSAGGRGLVILRSIARAWGVEPGPAEGKRVWAELALPG